MSLILLIVVDFPLVNRKSLEENLKRFCAWEGKGEAMRLHPIRKKGN